jgi:diaminopimelate epimerase
MNFGPAFPPPAPPARTEWDYPFTKMQAVGNDFVVVEESAWPTGTDWSKAATFLCERRFGVGGDGLLLVGPSDVADVRMRMFNPDGTEDMCGNGLRCVAVFAYGKGLLNLNGFLLESQVGIHQGIYWEDENLWAIQMGTPQFAPAEIPINLPNFSANHVLNYPLRVGDEIIPVSSVSTGSTHSVLFVDALPSDERFFSLSPKIEHHPAFPERTSVLWAAPAPETEAGGGFIVRIWERGAGETLGCGTGACAVAVLALVTGRSDSNRAISIVSRGGVLNVDWDPANPEQEMFLIGPAATVYVGMVSYDAKG